MLSFEERLALLENELSNTTPDQLFEELSSYEAKGPLAMEYLNDITHGELTRVMVRQVKASSTALPSTFNTTKKSGDFETSVIGHFSLAA